MAELTKKQKVGIGVGVAVVVVVVVLLIVLLWPRSSSAARKDSNDKGEPIKRPPGPDPMAPTTKPTKGQYYIVKDGDSDALICQKAGFAAGLVYEARTTMRDHERNAWIPKKGSGVDRQLNLFQGWAPMDGHADLSWAWQTERITWGGAKWPIVYVPTDAEVPA